MFEFLYDLGLYMRCSIIWDNIVKWFNKRYQRQTLKMDHFPKMNKSVIKHQHPFQYIKSDWKQGNQKHEKSEHLAARHR